MTGSRFQTATRALTLALLTLTTASRAPAREPDSELIQQQERQREIRAETDRTVRQIETIIRVMQLYGVEKGEEQQLLQEAASTLAGLSREQMSEVIARLDAAARAASPPQADAEKEAAYARHREIVAALKAMLARRDALQSLEDAAHRLTKAAQEQRGLHLSASALVRIMTDPALLELDASSRKKTGKAYYYVLRQVSDSQADLHSDTKLLLEELLPALAPALTAEQQERVKRATAQAAKMNLLEDMYVASRKLRTKGYAEIRHPAYQTAVDLQWRLAGDLQALAGGLRSPPDRLRLLRAAREQLEQLTQGQESVRATTGEQPADEPLPGELLGRQGELGHQTRDLRALLEPAARDVADLLEPGEKQMLEALRALQSMKPQEAGKPQARALEALRSARQALDRAIAAEEKLRNDPLAAVRHAAATVEQLLVEQKEVRKDTAAREERPAELPQLVDRQQQLAQRADQLKNTPLPGMERTAPALDRAALAMTRASGELSRQQGARAGENQDRAIAALEEAKKLLEEKAAEIEKRKEEIAQLEKAAKQLDELIRAEKKVADAARDLPPRTTPSKAAEVGKSQGELIPQTRDLATTTKSAAPQAAASMRDSTTNMQAAQAQLEKNAPGAAADQADQAAQKLQEAQQALARALDERKAADIQDQAALQPGQVSPAAAAQQVAKALEQLQTAQAQAGQAAAQMAQAGPPQAQPMQQGQPNLVQLQQQVANQAARLGLQEASLPAAQAAAALQQGQLNQALQQQQQALQQLQQAAAQPMQGQPMNGQPMQGGQPQQGQPQPGQPMQGGQPQKGQPMNGQPMQGGQPQQGGQPMQGGKPMQGGQPQQGQPMQGGKPQQGQPMQGGKPQAAPGAAQVAQLQQAVLQATRAMAQSQQATANAQAAVTQAQAQAPGAVQPQLGQAQAQLGQAQAQLGQGAPGQAAQAQGQAQGQLGQALQALNAAATAMGQPSAQPGQPSSAVASAAQPGQGQGMGQGQGQGMGQGQTPGQGMGQGQGTQPGPGQERNLGRGEGSRTPDGQLKNAASELLRAQGSGAFIHLPPRQRDLIRQALQQSLPPEYAAMIQQYYLNIARGRSAGPAPPPRR